MCVCVWGVCVCVCIGRRTGFCTQMNSIIYNNEKITSLVISYTVIATTKIYGIGLNYCISMIIL